MTAAKQEIAKREEPADAGALVESVIVKGDLSKLSPTERSHYYMKVCESVGLNPLTKPFEYITLNNKLTLYALRAATDQLRAIHKVSVVDLTENERDDVYIVTAKMQNGDGRTDMAKGAVKISGLKGDALANAIMKAETKAKRRATLSICGLGFLDETEIETIPVSATRPRKSSAQAKRDGDWEAFEHDLSETRSAVSVERLRAEYESTVFPTWNDSWQKAALERIEARIAEFSQSDLSETMQDAVDLEGERETYIEWCHGVIEEAGTADELSLWWRHNARKRRELALTQEQVDGLRKRMTRRVKAMDAAKEETSEE